MENQVFIAESVLYKSAMVRNQTIWLCADRKKSVASFEKAMKKTGIMRSTYSIPYDAIQEIKVNESSNLFKFKYINEKGKLKSLSLGFESNEDANHFGLTIGDECGMDKQYAKENQMTPLIWNALYFLLALAVSISFGIIDMSDNLEEPTGSAKNRGKKELFKLVYDTIGQVGICLIGGAITAYLGYKLYKRYKNPAYETTYRRVA